MITRLTVRVSLWEGRLTTAHQGRPFSDLETFDEGNSNAGITVEGYDVGVPCMRLFGNLPSGQVGFFEDMLICFHQSLTLCFPQNGTGLVEISWHRRYVCQLRL